jgi:hypothetical protein
VAAGASITNMASVLGLVGDPDHVQHSCKSTLEWAECKVRGERIVEREFRITRAGERLMLPVIEEK